MGLVDPRRLTTRGVTLSPGGVYSIAPLRAGDYLTGGGDGAVRRMDDSGAVLATSEPLGFIVVGLTVTPDERTAVATTARGVVAALDAQTLRVLWQRKITDAPLSDVDVDAERGLIVTSSDDGFLRVVRLSDGSSAREDFAAPGPVYGARLNPQRTLLAAAGDGARTTVLRWPELTPVSVPLGTDGATLDVFFLDDGQRVVLVGSDRAVRIYLAEPGEELLVLTGHPGQVFSGATFDQGRGLATIDGLGYLLEWHAPEAPPASEPAPQHAD